MNEILQYLKKHGERSDKEIAEALGISLADLHPQLAELKAKNQVMVCQSTKFVKGKGIESVICRISGYIPPAKPGAKSGSKSKVQLKLS
jgi:transcription initiation factor IIE alpha subunit